MNKKHTIMAGILASGLLLSANTASASMNTGFSPTASEAKATVIYKWGATNNVSSQVNLDEIMQLSFAQLLNLQNVNKININEVEKKPEVVTPAKPVEEKPEVVTPAKPVEEKPEVKAPVAPIKEKPEVKAPVEQKVEQTPVVQKQTPEVKDEVKVTSEIQQVVDLTNQERAKAGLKALQIDTKLTQSAQAKSQDMKNKNYFSHTSPTYGSPFDQMKSMGITYKSAAENIAMGQRSPQEVVDAWMKSPGHKANIMNASFTHIGVGLSDSGYYWTQQFIGK
ncbi:uncharacterized protein, YkwD family [Psychrobacillus sp. OK028]|uniref:CAP domain-containing protein n=1 Tax=Psychrobacillus sp. OK028 TaxID=1884359 RepID=UPI00088905BF|nr:CAP domain-containing protein [Psychrobacillus sp. OK028]SDN07256.1 uncharacterized protein, YkwD family [Psychrobacillus sp. OK028]